MNYRTTRSTTSAFAPASRPALGDLSNHTFTRTSKDYAAKQTIARAPRVLFDSQKDETFVDMFNHYHELEKKKSITNNFLKYQNELDERMRAILVDWLISVCDKFKVQTQTLYVTIGILDRILSRKIVPRKKFQLVGVTAFFLACKYEEIYCPRLEDLQVVSSNNVRANDIVRMEKVILQALKFECTFPTSWLFLNRMIGDLKWTNTKSGHMAMFLCERMLQEYDMLAFKPSMVASSCLYVVREMDYGTAKWTPELASLSTYTAKQLEECVGLVRRFASEENEELEGAKKKFNSERYSFVSDLYLRRF